jgi:alkylhydroperoxidase family enzyme
VRLAVARDEGLNEATIANVLNRKDDSFSPLHQAALALADAIMTTPARLDPALITDLRGHFTNEQLIEITLDIMKWNGQKVPVALGVDVWLAPGELTDLNFDEQGNWVR